MYTIALGSMTKAYLVDDDRAMLKSLSFVLGKAGIECNLFEDPREFLDASENEDLGCAIVDLSMPSMTGIELLRELRSRKFSRPVVVLTGCGSVTAAVEAMQLGAIDFLEKPIEYHRLIGAVNRSFEITKQDSLENESAEMFASKVRTLTSRQREVMDCVAEGLPSKQIAKKLQISIKTVEVHRSQLAKKLGVNSLAALIQLLTRYKLARSA